MTTRAWLVLAILTPTALRAANSNACAQAVEAHRAGKPAAALPFYEECLKNQPASVELRSNYGAALAREGRYQDAVIQYRKALESAPDRAQFRLNLALAYYKQGDLPNAVSELKTLQAAAPDNMQVNLLLADCYLRLGELRPIIDLLAPMEAAHREDPGFAYLLGTALIRSGEVKRGEAVVDHILRDANSPEARFLLASAAFANEDYPGAVREFAKAIEKNPNLPEAWAFYGLSLLYTGDADGAMSAFRKELAGNPNDYEANVKLGAILAARAQYSDALPFLDRARLLRPASKEARSEYDAAKAGVPVAAAKDAGLLAVGAKAPAFSLHPLAGTVPVTAAGPVVLVFGSYTCPKFRFGAPGLNKLYDQYRQRIRFAMVYIHEAHGDGDWQSTINSRVGVEQPPARNATEKAGYAVSCARTLSIRYPLASDGMDRAVENTYHAWPSAAYVIGRDGRILWASRLGEFEFEPAALEKAIQKVLEK